MKIRCIVFTLILVTRAAGAFASPLWDLYEAAIRRDVPPGSYVYNWRDAVLLDSFIDIYRSSSTERERIAAYVSGEMERLAPTAHGVHPNGIASAVGFAFLKEIGHDSPATGAALERVLEQYARIPRTADGTCSHRVNSVELWDDTLYMLDLALLGCYRASGDVKYPEKLAEEVLGHSKYLMDGKSGLWYHAWAESDAPVEDGCGIIGWNANPLHRNTEFWGRGNGWIAMTLVDLLECLPRSDSRYRELRSMYRRMMRTLRRLQDSGTGLWYQLPAHPADEGNYLESSCSGMFGYAAAKGARLGLLPRGYRKVGRRAWRGIVEHCLDYDADGVHLTRICPGTCVGDKSYYYSRGTVSGGETYAVGAAILLGNEIENL